MKATILLICLVTGTVYSQQSQQWGPSMNQRSGVTAPNPLDQPAQSQPIVLMPLDPYRVIDGSIYMVSGIDAKNGWVEFSGKVLEVQPGGIRVEGYYTGSGVGDYYEGVEFFVADYPYEVAEGERIGQGEKTFMCAKMSGTYTYPTAIGGSRTIRKLDYGTIYKPPPPTPEQIAQAKTNAIAARAKADAAKKAAEEKALKMNQDLAAKGDAYGLLRMGERYRDGTGVEKDLLKAREYFTNAIAAGSLDASNELARLPPQQNP